MLSVNPREYPLVSGSPKAISNIILICTDQIWKRKITVNFSLRDTVSNVIVELKTLSQLLYKYNDKMFWIFQTHYFGGYTISKHSFHTILTAHEKLQNTQPNWWLCAKTNVVKIFSQNFGL